MEYVSAKTKKILDTIEKDPTLASLAKAGSLVPKEGDDYVWSAADKRGIKRRKFSSEYKSMIAAVANEVGNYSKVSAATGVFEESEAKEKPFNVDPQTVSKLHKEFYPSEHQQKTAPKVDVSLTTEYKELEHKYAEAQDRVLELEAKLATAQKHLDVVMEGLSPEEQISVWKKIALG